MKGAHDDDPPPSEAVWDLFRRDEPDPRAIQAAYLRFAGRRPERLSALRLSRWLAVGFVAGLGVAFAATGAPLLGAGLFRTLRSGTTAESATPGARPVKPGPAREPPAPPAVSSAGIPLRTEPASSGTPAVLPAPRGALSEHPATDPKWQRAAAALKTHDYVAAETALREVETTGAPADREAASLALAQVLLSRGRSVEARARLERLRARASSPLVREKAATLLDDTFSSGGRSAAGGAVPQ